MPESPMKINIGAMGAEKKTGIAAVKAYGKYGMERAAVRGAERAKRRKMSADEMAAYDRALDKWKKKMPWVNWSTIALSAVGARYGLDPVRSLNIAKNIATAAFDQAPTTVGMGAAAAATGFMDTAQERGWLERTPSRSLSVPADPLAFGIDTPGMALLETGRPSVEPTGTFGGGGGLL